MSPTFCALPWVHLFVGEVGTLRPCCMALEDPEAVNRDEAGVPYRIEALADIEPAWNSGFMRGLRRALAAGERPAACARCFREEDLGLRSHRQVSNEQFGAQAAQAVACGGADGSAMPGLIHSLDIRLGNRCNLKCRMCSPVSSRATASDYAALYQIERNDPRLRELAGPNWVARPGFQPIFERLAAGAQRMQFSGGEPLLRPELTAMLEGLVASGRAAEVDLHFVTNLTYLPDRMLALWGHFRRVGVVVSLDGVGALGEYIRNGMRFEAVAANLRRLDAAAGAIRCDSLHLAATVQAYNVLAVDEIVAFSARELPRFGRPKLSLLYFPEALSVTVLPAELKARAEARLRALLVRVRGEWAQRWPADEREDLTTTIEAIITHMNGSDRADLLPEFRRWTRVLDRQRGEDITRAIPELAPVFEGQAAHGD